jgi:Kef-type K+ transport system membrane component KefB
MKQVVLYVILIVSVATAIFGLLELGSSLPMPASTAADARAAAAATTQRATAQPASRDSGLLQGLRANVDHPLSRLFVQLLVIIAAAQLMGRAFTRMGLSAVVGEMAAGLLLGPSLLGLLAPGAFAFVFPADSLGSLQLLSQVGICLFMFSVGMDLNMQQVRSRARAAVVVSTVSILVPFLLGVTLAYFLFTDLAGPRATFAAFAPFLGISLSITAFPVLARILQERGMTRTFLGSTAIACAAAGDVAAWTIMAFVVASARSTTLDGGVLTVALALLLIAVMSFGVRPALPRWLGSERLARKEPSRGTLAVVLLVLLAAALSTELIGIHALFGAFLAGAVMPQADGFRQKIDAHVQRFSSVLLLPLFFAFTGLRTQIGLLADAQGWLLCLSIIAIATLGKLGASAVAARFTGMSWRESLQLGALMNTRGLMELIALNVGYDLGILSQRIFTMLVIMALVTTLLTGPLLTLFGYGRTSANEREETSHA